MKQITTLTIFVVAALMFLGSGCRGKQNASPAGQNHQRSTSKSSPVATTPQTATSPSPLPLSPTPRIIRRHADGATSDSFVVRQSSVYFPGYDDIPHTSQPTELLRLEPEVFSRTTNIYNKRAICTRPNNETTTFTLPAQARQIALVCRGRAVEGEWPRVRVTLVDGKRTSQRHVLFEGNIQWRELRYLWMPIPDEYRNHLVFLKVEILNPNYYFSQRALYIAYVIVS